MAKTDKRKLDQNIAIIDNNPSRNFDKLRYETAHKASAFSDQTDDLKDKIYYAETGYDLYEDNMTLFFLARAYDMADRKEEALLVCDKTKLNGTYAHYHMRTALIKCSLLLEQGSELSFDSFVATMVQYPEFANNWPTMDRFLYAYFSDEQLTQKVTDHLEETLKTSPNEYRNLFVLGAYKAIRSNDKSIRDEGLSQCKEAIDMQPNHVTMIAHYPYIEACALGDISKENSVQISSERLLDSLKQKANTAFDNDDEAGYGFATGMHVLRLVQAWNFEGNTTKYSVIITPKIPFKNQI